ncbi:hypothetical protein GCM10009647_086000 [Streptomyces sanglieri]|uniref:Uncharacterized protein n=1 Tax=Streptomyces sanglieri TaxID=193460 RepID=A0ABW2X9N6_9ACTN
MFGPTRLVRDAFGIADAMGFAHPGLAWPALVAVWLTGGPGALALPQVNHRGWGIKVRRSGQHLSPGWQFSGIAITITRWESLTRPAPAPTDAAGWLRSDFVE